MPRSQSSKQKLRLADRELDWWVIGPVAAVLFIVNLALLLRPEVVSPTFLVLLTAILIVPAVVYSHPARKTDWKGIGAWLVVNGPVALLLLLLGAGLMAGLGWILLGGIE